MVERLEGARGPNSILYGDALSGGEVNTIIKRAEFRDRATIGARTDSEGSYRSTFDVNRKLTNQFALRVNALYQRRRTWEKAFFDNRSGLQVTGTYRPWKGGEVRAEGEQDYSSVARMSTSEAFTDNSSLWDRTTTVNAPLTSSPASATGLSRYTTDTLIYSPAYGGILNFLNFARTNGTGLRMLDGFDGRSALLNFPVVPRAGFRVRPAEARLGTHVKTASIYFNQSFDNGFVLELAAQGSAVNIEGVNEEWSNSYIDVNRVLPNGQSNPNFGKFYSEKSISNYGQNPTINQSYRAAAAYPFVTRYFKQTFSLVAQRRLSFFGPELYRFSRLTNPTVLDIRDSRNVVTFRQYWDDPTGSLVFPVTQNTDPNYGWVLARNTDQHTALQGLQFNTIGSYFKDRLTLIGGIRRDDFHFDSQNISTFDKRGYPLTYDHNIKQSTTTTRSIGAVFFPIEQVGIYSNYSEAFAPNTQNFPDITGVFSVPTTLSHSRTLGLRFRLFDGKIVGSVGYYRSNEARRPLSVTTSAVNQIWLDLGKPQNQIGGGAYANYVDTFDYEAHGVEADVVANPTKSMRLMFNIAFPRTEQANSFTQSKAYLAANIAEWQAGANDLNNPNHTRISNNVGSFQNTILTATDGRPVNFTYNYRANAFVSYEFSHGWMRGVRVGAGSNVFGPRLIGSPTTQPYKLIYAPGFATATASISYYRKLKNIGWYLQLNVSNAFDYDKPVYVDVGTYQGVTYRNTYQYLEPRKATLSTSFTF